MDETYNDLYPLQLKDPEVPIQEDCSSDIVPAGTTDMEGKKKVLVPELITMTRSYLISVSACHVLIPEPVPAKWDTGFHGRKQNHHPDHQSRHLLVSRSDVLAD